MKSDYVMHRLLECHGGDIQTVLDVGAGDGHYTRAFQAMGKTVTAIDLRYEGEGQVDFDSAVWWSAFPPRSFHAVWAAHVLEHASNVGMFLDGCWILLPLGGYLAISVPPLKHNIVGGHVSLWNAGLLMYRLILAGFDCSQIKLRREGYNIGAIVQKTDVAIPLDQLVHDAGDIETLAPYFPAGHNMHGFNGQIEEINWVQAIEQGADSCHRGLGPGFLLNNG